MKNIAFRIELKEKDVFNFHLESKRIDFNLNDKPYVCYVTNSKIIIKPKLANQETRLVIEVKDLILSFEDEIINIPIDKE